MEKLITKKFAQRMVNHICDNWFVHYVLDRLVEISITVDEMHRLTDLIDCENPDIPIDRLIILYKKALHSLVLSKNVIIDL